MCCPHAPGVAWFGHTQAGCAKQPVGPQLQWLRALTTVPAVNFCCFHTSARGRTQLLVHLLVHKIRERKQIPSGLHKNGVTLQWLYVTLSGLGYRTQLPTGGLGWTGWARIAFESPEIKVIHFDGRPPTRSPFITNFKYILFLLNLGC